MVALPVLHAHAPPLQVMALHPLASCRRRFCLEEVEEIRVADAAMFACCELRAGLEAEQLLMEIRLILYERRFVLPAPRVVGDLARRAREIVERDVSAAIERAIPPATRARWVEKLFEVRADGMPCTRSRRPAASCR